MIWEKLQTVFDEFTDKEALVFQNHRISYRELGTIVNRLANGLKESGIGKGDRVVLMLPNVPHFVFSYYAVLKIGAQVVPLNYLMELDDLNSCLNIIKPRAVIFWEKFRTLLNIFFAKSDNATLPIVLGSKKNRRELSLTHLIANSDDSNDAENLEDDSVGLIQFTLGIGDFPKPAQFSHAAMEKSYLGLNDFFRFSESDSFLAVLPLVLSVSQSAVMNSSFLSGSKLVLMPKVEVESVKQFIVEESISVIIGTPKLFAKVATTDGLKKHNLKYCISVNSFLNEQIRSEFQEKYDIPLLNAYSVTEAGGIIASMHPASFNPEHSVGMALPHIEVQLFNENNELLPVGEEGELLVRGESLFSSYLGNEELTNKFLRDGWFYTGDIGKKYEDGTIYLSERKSNIILKSGFRIHASEIEKILCSHPKVKEAAVIGIPHPSFKEDLKAFVVTNENSVTQEDLIEFCKQKFPLYMCPAQIEFRKQLPRTRMGRISKRKLKSEVWI